MRSPVQSQRERRGTFLHPIATAITVSTAAAAGSSSIAEVAAPDVASSATDAVSSAAVAEATGSFSPIELLILFTPLGLYALFNVYRSANPKAKLSDFALAIAATVLVGNIFSIVFLKVRWF